jgi:hypothetical protein
LPDGAIRVSLDPAQDLSHLKHRCVGVDAHGNRVNAIPGQWLNAETCTPFDTILFDKELIKTFAAEALAAYKTTIREECTRLLPIFLTWKKTQLHYEWSVFQAAVKQRCKVWPGRLNFGIIDDTVLEYFRTVSQHAYAIHSGQGS